MEYVRQAQPGLVLAPLLKLKGLRVSKKEDKQWPVQTDETLYRKQQILKEYSCYGRATAREAECGHARRQDRQTEGQKTKAVAHICLETSGIVHILER